MRTIYSVAIGFYALAARMAACFNKKASLMTKGWREWEKTLNSKRETLDSSPVAWFHAASLGEFEQARPVLEQFRKEHPEYKVLLTFFSPSGYEIRKNYDGADAICYLPPDTRRNARKLIQLAHPDIAFFVKYEFWFNYLKVLQDKSIPTYLFSAIFRPKQFFFRWYGGWFSRQLKSYRHIFVQNEESLNLLRSIGITECSITGDTRFDRVDQIARQAKSFPEIEKFLGTSPVLMAGSSWEPDEENLKPFITAHPEIKVIIAPHMIGEEHLKSIETLFGKDNCIRYSALINSQLTIDNSPRTLIIDNIGMLSSLYRYATVAYIGGGFGRGIHNTLEAAVFGCPVCFGPNHTKFQEAMGLLDCGGAKSYTSAAQLSDILTQWFTDNEALKKASTACNIFMNKNLGSTEAILENIKL